MIKRVLALVLTFTLSASTLPAEPLSFPSSIARSSPGENSKDFQMQAMVPAVLFFLHSLTVRFASQRWHEAGALSVPHASLALVTVVLGALILRRHKPAAPPSRNQ